MKKCSTLERTNLTRELSESFLNLLCVTIVAFPDYNSKMPKKGGDKPAADVSEVGVPFGNEFDACWDI